MKEICICAAVKADDGTIIRCHRHSDGLFKLHELGKTAQHEWAIQGFITSENRFVDRLEGLRLQLDAGIKSADPTGKYHGDQLFSEDLY